MDSEQYELENFSAQECEEVLPDVEPYLREIPTGTRAGHSARQCTAIDRPSVRSKDHLEQVYAEMRRLSNRVRQLEAERDILKIAFAFLKRDKPYR